MPTWRSDGTKLARCAHIGNVGSKLMIDGLIRLVGSQVGGLHFTYMFTP